MNTLARTHLLPYHHHNNYKHSTASPTFYGGAENRVGLPGCYWGGSEMFLIRTYRARWWFVLGGGLVVSSVCVTHALDWRPDCPYSLIVLSISQALPVTTSFTL